MAMVTIIGKKNELKTGSRARDGVRHLLAN